jgi:hypothetical protein
MLQQGNCAAPVNIGCDKCFLNAISTVTTIRQCISDNSELMRVAKEVLCRYTEGEIFEAML